MKQVLSYLVMPLICLFAVSGLEAAQQVNDVRQLDSNQNGRYDEGEVDPCASYQTGPCTCYCPVTRFRAKNYCETKCVQEPYTCTKKCCRYVDQTCTKKCCRYVPQYYEKTCCRQVPQAYTKTCCRMVQVPQYYEKTCYRQVPEYYTKTCCRQVPEYYDQSYCKKVPEYYTVCETKYRNKYVQEPRCCYEPYTCMEVRCVNAPMESVCNAGQAPQQYSQNQNYTAAQPVAANRGATRDPVAISGAQLAGNGDLTQLIQSKIEDRNLLEGSEFVDINFSNGTVILSGVVLTPAKRSQIETLVSGVNGVQKVDNRITVGKPAIK